MNRRTLALTLAGLLTLGGAGVALAGGGPGGHRCADGHRGHHGPPSPDRLAELLDLDEAQTEALRAMHADHEADREAHHKALEAAHEALHAEMSKAAPDATTVHARIDAVTALKAEAAHARADGMLTLTELLTPEQREVFASHRAERHARHGGGPGGPPGRRGPPPGGHGPGHQE